MYTGPLPTMLSPAITFGTISDLITALRKKYMHLAFKKILMPVSGYRMENILFLNNRFVYLIHVSSTQLQLI